jgi:hypothetical protein
MSRVSTIREEPRTYELGEENQPELQPGLMRVYMQDGTICAVNFLCPCCSKAQCYTEVCLNAKDKKQHVWVFSRGANGPTIAPSVRYLSGCKAHFTLTDGKVIFHEDCGR